MMRYYVRKGWATKDIAQLFDVAPDTVRLHTNEKSAKRIRAHWAKRDAKRRSMKNEIRT